MTPRALASPPGRRGASRPAPGIGGNSRAVAAGARLVTLGATPTSILLGDFPARVRLAKADTPEPGSRAHRAQELERGNRATGAPSARPGEPARGGRVPDRQARTIYRRVAHHRHDRRRGFRRAFGEERTRGVGMGRTAAGVVLPFNPPQIATLRALCILFQSATVGKAGECNTCVLRGVDSGEDQLRLACWPEGAI